MINRKKFLRFPLVQLPLLKGGFEIIAFESNMIEPEMLLQTNVEFSISFNENAEKFKIYSLKTKFLKFSTN